MIALPLSGDDRVRLEAKFGLNLSSFDYHKHILKIMHDCLLKIITNINCQGFQNTRMYLKNTIRAPNLINLPCKTIYLKNVVRLVHGFV